MTNQKTESMGCAAAILWLLAAIPLGILRAFVAAILWGWFIVPLGVPSIGTWHAYGIILLISLIKPDPIQHQDQPLTRDQAHKRIFTHYSTYLTLILVAWGLGAIVHALWGG